MLHQRLQVFDWKCNKVSGQPLSSNWHGIPKKKKKIRKSPLHTHFLFKKEGCPWSEWKEPRPTETLSWTSSPPPHCSLYLFIYLLSFLNPRHVSEHCVTERKHHCRSQRESLVNKPVSKTPARASFSHSLPRWVGGLFSDIKSPQQLKTKAHCGFTELRQKS